MIYELSKEYDANRAKARLNNLIAGGKVIELTARKVSRTTKQNSALHQFFTFISDELNDMGLEFAYQGIKGMEMYLRYTPELVKDFIWRPIQIALFEIQSTKDLDTKQMNDIIDILIKYFGERGIEIAFPCIED
jgi:hypothetical protein